MTAAARSQYMFFLLQLVCFHTFYTDERYLLSMITLLTSLFHVYCAYQCDRRVEKEEWDDKQGRFF